ncbi:Uncharacterised protein g7195 [Pycnogonum litorale]
MADVKFLIIILIIVIYNQVGVDGCQLDRDCTAKNQECDFVHEKCVCKDGYSLQLNECKEKVGWGKKCYGKEDCNSWLLHCKTNSTADATLYCLCKDGYIREDGECSFDIKTPIGDAVGITIGTIVAVAVGVAVGVVIIISLVVFLFVAR